jgi:hypothetical protein
VPKSTLSFTGTLPGGVTFTPFSNGTATLSGTAVAGSKGVYFLTITAVNGTLPNSVQLFTLRVQDTAPVLHAPAIISPVSTTFTAGTEGTFTVHTTGVPTATLSLTGTQPSWLSFIDNTDGTATLTVRRARARDLKRYVSSWTGSFSCCDGMQDRKKAHLAKVDAALVTSGSK